MNNKSTQKSSPRCTCMKMYCECVTYESYFSRNEPTLKRETNERYLTGNHVSMTEEQIRIICEEVKRQNPSYFPDK